MAEMEHARFNVERLLGGWTLGPQRDREKKISPTLVAWSELPEIEKNKDRQAVQAIPELLKQFGLEIRRMSAEVPRKMRRSKRK
jgi:RyR domain